MTIADSEIFGVAGVRMDGYWNAVEPLIRAKQKFAANPKSATPSTSHATPGVVPLARTLYPFKTKEGWHVQFLMRHGSWWAKLYDVTRQQVPVVCAPRKNVETEMHALSNGPRSLGWSRLHVLNRDGHRYVFLGSMGLMGGTGETEEKPTSEDHANGPEQKVENATQLYFAAYDGLRNDVRSLIEQGTQINQGISDGRTALHAAAYNNRSDIVRLLVELGASVDLAADDGITPLSIASALGHLETVRTLVELGASVDLAKDDGTTPLYSASAMGNLETVRTLVELGASVDLAKDDGTTPLSIATQHGKLETVRMLVEYGASIDQKTGNGKTPLMIAEEESHDDIVEYLKNGSHNPQRPRAQRVDSKLKRTPSMILDCLTEGTIIAGRFEVKEQAVPRKGHIRFAIDRETGNEVILKFYRLNYNFLNAADIYPRLNPDFVCKMLGVIYDPNYPPCIIYEKADYSLESIINNGWMEDEERNACLQQILLCINHLRKIKVVHRDVKPRNILYFSSSQTWKLSDFDNAKLVNDPSSVCYSPAYGPPEIMVADREEQEKVIPSTSADMWSFGIIVYEFFMRKRFYGNYATVETVEIYLYHREKDFPRLDAIEDKRARRLVKHLLTFQPERRWSARKALANATFTPREATQEAEAAADQVSDYDSEVEELRASIKEIRDVAATEMDEVAASRLLVNLDVEEFPTSFEGNRGFEHREARTALMVRENRPKDPIFLLHLNTVYRLRISLKHRYENEAGTHKIRGVFLELPDRTTERLVTKPAELTSNEHEVLALLRPEELDVESMQRLSPDSRDLGERYVKLKMAIVLENEVEKEIVKITDTVYGKMVADGNPLLRRRRVGNSVQFRSQCPRWVKTGGHGHVFVAAPFGFPPPAATVGNPLWNMLTLNLFNGCCSSANDVNPRD